MAGYNRIIMIGNLTRDPDYKQLASGQGVARLGLASNRQYKNKQSGSMVQEVCFIDVDVYGPQADSCREYLQKGRPVLIEGRLKFDQWESPEGQTRSKHVIVADRVVFLAAGAGQEVEEEPEDVRQSKALEKDLLNRIDSVQKAQSAKARPVAPAQKVVEPRQPRKVEKADTQDFVLQDEQPFEDDLPF